MRPQGKHIMLRYGRGIYITCIKLKFMSLILIVILIVVVSDSPTATNQEVPTHAPSTDYKGSEYRLPPQLSSRPRTTPGHISPILFLHSLNPLQMTI